MRSPREIPGEHTEGVSNCRDLLRPVLRHRRLDRGQDTLG